MKFPLMKNNILKEDINKVIEFLQKEGSRLTQSFNVNEFEKEWSNWLGVKYSVYVNSGSSANLITMAVLKEKYGNGEIIVPPLTWVSDIASVIQNGFTPIFADINPKNLCMDTKEILNKITNNTKGVFITHAQGFNGLTEELLFELDKRKIPLIEDVCESHGATFLDKKLGTYGVMSNFSFYYAHHMSTIEGGMVCTNDENIYQMLRMFRSHGMVRESNNPDLQKSYLNENQDLNSDFIFAYPAYNVRNTEIGAVIGRNQLKRLDKNIEKRNNNLKLFLSLIDEKIYRTDFEIEGCSNYAFNLVLRKSDDIKVKKLIHIMNEANIEFRRGSAGGGNQIRQPYLKNLVPKDHWKNFPVVEHIHFYGFYIGNFPDLTSDDIRKICDIINSI